MLIDFTKLLDVYEPRSHQWRVKVKAYMATSNTHTESFIIQYIIARSRIAITNIPVILLLAFECQDVHFSLFHACGPPEG